MAEVQESLSEAITQAAGQYHRLVLLVGPFGGGKTAALQAVAKAAGYPLLNVNLELSKRLLELPRSQRPRQVSRLLKDVIAAAPGEVAVIQEDQALLMYYDNALMRTGD